jgi:glyoxylase-like metal-dependent hydrolase (beta-lactamase superfamily II)
MVTQLRDGVWQVELSGVNAYLADDGGTLTLVDGGTPIDGGRLRTAVELAGYHLTDLERVLVTHYDVDHVGALAGVIGDTGAEWYMGAADAPFLMGREKPPFLHHKGAFQRLTGPFARRPGSEPTLVADGDEVGSFVAYHTPGHTPGHTAFVSYDLDAAFVGDLVCERDGRLVPSSWMLSYDTDTVHDSIHDFADRSPAVDVVAMGHGVPFVRSGSVRLAELGERIEGGTPARAATPR